MTQRNPDPTDPATEPIELDPRRAAGPPGGWLDAVRTQLAFALVVLVTLAGFVLILLYYWRKGAALVGGALVLAAVFRALLPPRRAGLLAVRGRPVDVLTYTGLGALILFVAGTIAGGPLS
jgi:hypothetical protein